MAHPVMMEMQAPRTMCVMVRVVVGVVFHAPVHLNVSQVTRLHRRGVHPFIHRLEPRVMTEMRPQAQTNVMALAVVRAAKVHQPISA